MTDDQHNHPRTVCYPRRSPRLAQHPDYHPYTYTLSELQPQLRRRQQQTPQSQRAPTPQVDYAQTTGQHQATADPVPTWPLTSTSSQPPPGPLLTRCPPAQEADYANQPTSLGHDELFDYTVSYNQCHAFDQAAPTNEPSAQPHETSLPRSYHYTGQAEGYSSPRFPTEYSFARPTSAEKKPHHPPTSANDFITVLSANGEWRQIPLTPTANTGADDNIPHSELNRMAVQATNMGELWTKNNPPFTGSESDCTTTTSLIRRWERFCQVQWQSPTAPVAVRSFIDRSIYWASLKRGARDRDWEGTYGDET